MVVHILQSGVDGGHAADGASGAAGRASPASSSPEGGTGDDGGLADRLRHAVTLLPPPLGAPVELLELGRATRTIPPALRRALAARDGGCVAPGCDRPPAWTDAHHLEHWAAGAPPTSSCCAAPTTWPPTRAAGSSRSTRPPAKSP
jgi:hypothetical protein